jgi:uncharacterized protein YidB (DUF937 family)
MGIMDMIGGLLGGKKKGGAQSGGGGVSLPGGIELPAGLSNLIGGNGNLLKVLLPMLAGGGGALGGLGGLLSKFNQSGQGSKAQSWVGTGANESIHPDEVEQALGTDQVAKLAAEAGVSHEEAKSGLAALLPGLVDKLTPGGQLPDAGQLGGLIKGLDVGKLFN